jgi:hypothetical protein
MVMLISPGVFGGATPADDLWLGRLPMFLKHRAMAVKG